MARFAIAFLLAAFAVLATAAPTDFDITPTFAPPTTGDPAAGYRLYSDCDLATQTSLGLVGEVISGSVIAFAGDSDTAYPLCVRAYNAAGEGGFDAVATMTATLTAPPGPVTTTYVCELNPATGGTCTVAP